NVNWFLSLDHARDIIGKWREDYSSIRPHSSLGKLTPEEFLVQQMTHKNRKRTCGYSRKSLYNNMVHPRGVEPLTV
ncbi:MAG: integrase core domain-containing protein, partial [Chlorobiaceae bacterium]